MYDHRFGPIDNIFAGVGVQFYVVYVVYITS